MNASPCKYEEEVMAVLRSGPLSPELQAHMTGCVECSEAMLVASCLQHHAKSMGEVSIPSADLVWRRAWQRSRAEAAARAARPIQLVIHAGIAATIMAAFWMILGLSARLGSFSAPHYPSSLHAVSGVWIAVSVMAGAVTILTAVVGAVYILCSDQARIAPMRNITRQA